jgi:hypothetical protein
MMMLITVLQQDFKVQYNPERITDVDFTKSQDLFIHGMIGSGNGGTCVSMPVLYTAVARRLGYPVFLVAGREHIFCRWEGRGERFNIEATNQGMNSFEDDYYMKWPKPISEVEVKAGHYLKSLDASDSLAVFLASRGHCLQDTGQLAAARVAYAMAAEKSPNNPIYAGFLVKIVAPRWRAQTFAAMPPRYSPDLDLNIVRAFRPEYENVPAFQHPMTIPRQYQSSISRPFFSGTVSIPQSSNSQPSPIPTIRSGDY